MRNQTVGRGFTSLSETEDSSGSSIPDLPVAARPALCQEGSGDREADLLGASGSWINC